MEHSAFGKTTGSPVFIFFITGKILEFLQNKRSVIQPEADKFESGSRRMRNLLIITRNKRFLPLVEITNHLNILFCRSSIVIYLSNLLFSNQLFSALNC